jgi:glutaconate CoA-transferase subunit A
MAAILSLAQAVEDNLKDGDTVAMEGFTHLIPFAAGHEVIRQGRKRLSLIRMTPDLIYDQMIGMGCAEKVVFSWGGNPGVGSLHRFRDAMKTAGPTRSRSKSTATPPWRTPSTPAPRGCPSRSSAAIAAPS